MTDVTELYDDLVAIRRAAQVLPKTASRETRDDLKVVLKRIEGKLTVELHALPEDELEETLESLDELYDGLARVLPRYHGRLS